MDKALRIFNYNNYRHRAVKKLYVASLKPDAFLFSHTAMVQNKRKCSSNFPLWNSNIRNDLCNRRRIPLHLHMCSFHLNSVHYNKFGDFEKGNTSGGGMSGDAKNENSTKENDPEPRKILSEIRNEFNVQDKESVDLNENSSSGELKKLVKSFADIDKILKEKQIFKEIDEFEEVEIEIPRWKPEDFEGMPRYLDIEDLMIVLKAERARDISVIGIPQALLIPIDYWVWYMVIVTAISPRHCRTIFRSVEAACIHKNMQLYTDDRFNPVFRKIRDSKDGIACDIGTIILYIYLPEARNPDFETYWEMLMNSW